jgi:CheY-like chemotaxis protein
MSDTQVDSARRTRPNGSILVASDAQANANMVSELLAHEFNGVRASWIPDSAVLDFEANRPQVLVLAFEELQKAELYYLGLYRQRRAIHVQPHRTIVLCHKDEVKRAFELCRTEHFDDYILFWPMSYDGFRLPMAVYNALRYLAAAQGTAQYPREVVDGAQRLVTIGEFIDNGLAEGAQHIEAIRSTADRIGSQALTEAVAPAERWMDKLHAGAAQYVDAAKSMGPVAQRGLRRVLVVDDDPFQRQLLAKYLSSEPYEVLFATESSEAFAIAMADQPDMILMDVMLPGIDGIEATRRIHADPNLSKIPVVMLTGKRERQTVIDSRRAGATDFLVKPIDRNVLITKLREALGDTAPKAT